MYVSHSGLTFGKLQMNCSPSYGDAFMEQNGRKSVVSVNWNFIYIHYVKESDKTSHNSLSYD